MASDRRRSFNQSERNQIYQRAGGSCEKCGKPLDDQWHADHKIPFSQGGETSIENGQAYCAECNQKKSDNLPDTVLFRPFQENLVRTALARYHAGDKTTLGIVCAGSGKTFAYIAAANEFFRQGLIDAVIIAVPRKNLKDQAEGDCVDYLKQCGTPQMRPIIARDNVAPLIQGDKFGCAVTYAAIVADSKNQPANRLFETTATKYAGRFLLVLDESQFLGADEKEGTQAAKLIEEVLAPLAAHTIIVSGTPTRSDQQPLVLVEYGPPDEKGIRYPLWHVRATYQEGVRLGYLRPCEFRLVNGKGIFRYRQTNVTEAFEINQLEEFLYHALKKDDIWQELVDRSIEEFRLKRQLNERYRWLILAIDRDHGRQIEKYIAQKYPDLKFVLAISDDGQAQHILHQFRPKEKGGGDIGDGLIAVGMAYIGFDCASIIGVTILTNKRWIGWLEQAFMRGGRMWKERPVDEQMLVIVAPNDPRMVKIADKFRSDSELGLRERKERDCGETPERRDVMVESAEMTDEITMGISVDQDLTAEETAGLKEFIATLDRPPSLLQAAEVLRKAGAAIPKANRHQEQRQQSYRERRAKFGRSAQEKLSSLILQRHGIRSQVNPELFQNHIRHYQKQLNLHQNVPNADHLTEEQWTERLAILDLWLRS